MDKKKNKKHILEYKGCGKKKNWYFYALRNVVKKEKSESPQKFQHNTNWLVFK